MMTRFRLSIFYILLAVLFFGHAFDALTRHEHWPFSSYPMFASLMPAEFGNYEIVGLTNEHGITKEVPLNPNWIPNLPEYKLQDTLRRKAKLALSDPGPLHGMLSDFLVVYDTRRRLALHDGPPLIGLRLYLVDLSKYVFATTTQHPSANMVKHMVMEVDEKPVVSK